MKSRNCLRRFALAVLVAPTVRRRMIRPAVSGVKMRQIQNIGAVLGMMLALVSCSVVEVDEFEYGVADPFIGEENYYDTESDTAENPDSSSDADSDSATATGTDSDSDTVSDTISDSDSSTDSATATDSFTETDTLFDSASGTDTESDSGADSSSDSDTVMD
jgi:hypothetical protein